MNATPAGYKQTEVGMIPEDWEVGSLDRFWSVTDCKHVTAPFVGNGYPLASIKEVQSRFVDLADAKQTTQEFYSRLIEGGRMPRVGDLILSRNATVGEVAQVAEWHPPFAMGQDVVLLRKTVQKLSTNYLQAIFRSSVIASQLSDLMVGSTFKRANVQQIKSLNVPMPSANEQEAIAEALSDADAIIESQEQLLTKKRHLKQAAMQELLTGKKRLPGFSGEWEVKRLGDLSEMGSGGTPPSSVPEYYDGDAPWVAISDMTKGGKVIESTERNLSALGLANSAAQMFPVGTVLYAMYASLGECSIAGVSLCSSQAILGIRAKNNLRSEFLYYYLTSLKTIVKSLGQQGTQSNLNKGMVQDFRINLPSVDEQTAITAILSDMDAELADLEGQLAKTRALKQGMMQKLLTGEIRLI